MGAAEYDARKINNAIKAQPGKVKVDPPPNVPKGGGKNRNKGKSSYKGGLLVVGRTDDRRMLCFKFNGGEPCDGSCGMLHVCRVKVASRPNAS